MKYYIKDNEVFDYESSLTYNNEKLYYIDHPEIQAIINPPPTIEQLSENERYWRDSELQRMDIVFRIATDRKQDTENISQYSEALRVWPEHEQFPDSKYRPKEKL